MDTTAGARPGDIIHSSGGARLRDPVPAFAAFCSVVLVGAMIVGWRLLPEHITGLYSITDGNFTRWNYEYAFKWGHWFELAIFNPLAGLGTQFWTNMPWLNPGALVLQLPLPTQARITLSYLTHLLLIGGSFYVLARVTRLSRLAALFGILIFVLMLFPPFPMYWGTIIDASIAPFRLISMAAANLMLSAMIIVGGAGSRRTFAGALALAVAAMFWGVYASVTYFVFDLAVVAGFSAVLLVALPHRGRLLMLVTGLVLAFVVSGMASYLDALIVVSPRPMGRWIDLLNGLEALLADPETRARMLANLSTCQGQMRNYLPCIEQPSIIFFGASLAAALYCLALGNRELPHPYVRLYPSVIGTIAYGGYKGNSETAIVRRLREDIALPPGGEFKGSVATHFGYSETMSRLFPDADRYQRALLSPPYLWVTTQNSHQQSGLWAFDIPTFDEYGHMQTRSFYRFTRALLSERGFNYRLIVAYELDLDILRMLGVRYILSDVALAELPEVERLETRDTWQVRLFLYRLDGTNVGAWSPTEMAVIESGERLLEAIKAGPASLRTRVLLSEPAPVERIVPLRSGKLSFERGGFRFEGEAGDGWSLALLPVRFSRCWQPRGDAGETRLLRANYLITGLLFRGAVDVRYAFDFGPLRSNCRKSDAADMD
jgi:hypothetical protein